MGVLLLAYQRYLGGVSLLWCVEDHMSEIKRRTPEHKLTSQAAEL